MLMELALAQHHSQCTLNLKHVYREQDEWADQLTHEDTTGFNNELQITPDETQWHILDQLL